MRQYSWSLIYVWIIVLTYAKYTDAEVSSDGGKNSIITRNDENELDESEEELDIRNYGYGPKNGPNIWPKYFSDCDGTKQSPINLDTTTSITVHYPHLFWWDYNLKPHTMHIYNNGHSLAFKGWWDNDKEQRPYFWLSTGRKYVDNYIFHHVHFHWAETDDEGCEHTINNQTFPLEMHFVHFRRELSNILEAYSQPGGLSVVAVLFRISEHNNTAMDPIITNIHKVIQPDTAIEIEPFELARILPSFSKFFLHYNGSLTSPPCSESVVWIIRKEVSTISREQMQEFRQLLGHHGTKIGHNYRPVQPVNGRLVYDIR